MISATGTRSNGHKVAWTRSARKSRRGGNSAVAGIAAAMVLLLGALILLASVVYELGELERNIKM